MQKKRVLLAIFAMALMLVVAGCNLGGQVLTFNSFTPNVETLAKTAGETVAFSATTNKTATLTWTKNGGELSATTGATVSWTAPAAAGTYTVTVSASDGLTNITHSWTITVTANTTNHAPVITSSTPGSPLTAQAGSTKLFSVTATDQDNDTLSYTWSSTAGTLSATTGATVNWTAPASATTCTVKVVVSDTHTAVEKIWSVTVTEEATGNTAPVIDSFSPTTPQSINVNQNVDMYVVASDDDGDELTYAWTKTGGTLDVTDLDTVTWTAPAAAGAYTVTVVVSDGTDSDSQTWTMNVSDGTVVGDVVIVTEDIEVPTTWEGGKVYVIASSYFTISSTLTIQPGAIIKVTETYGIDTTESGIIKAQGTATSPIIFTSIRDDVHGGDTNEDQNATSPQRGDWDAIRLWGGSGSIFTYCQFYYGGSTDTTLDLKSKQAQVTYSTFAYNNGEGIGALAAYDALVGTVIQNNTFYNNVKPLTITTNYNIDDSNKFFNPANLAEGNTFNGIFVPQYCAATLSFIWAETEVPFVIQGSLLVETDTSFTLGDKVIVKFADIQWLGINGTLKADATNYIIFTSYHDDEHGGDTNGNGQETVPAAGNWDNIHISGPTASSFKNCQFYYGGYNGNFVLKLGPTTSTVQNSTFAHNLSAEGALHALSSLYNTVITGNRFYDNDIPFAASGQFNIDNSNIFTDQTGAIKNLRNGIFLGSYFSLDNSVVWGETDVPFVINDAEIPVDKSLTIQDNVVVKFISDGSLNVNGTLSAIATNRIVFTSFKDDSFLGDTDNDLAIMPDRGDWDHIWVDGTAYFTKCEFYYGGYGNHALKINGKANVLNSTFAHNSNYAIDASGASYQTQIKSNRFFDNESPLLINLEYAIDDSNSFTSVDGTVDNDYNRIALNWNYVTRSGISWSETEVPFYAIDGFRIDENYALTLGDNVIVKMGSSAEINISGSLVQGTNVWFTSLKDDTKGGDSNNDGNIPPAAGDWEGIWSDGIGDYITGWTNILYDSYAYPYNYQ